MCCAKFCDARGSEQRHPSRILPSQQEVVAIEVINSNVDAVQDCPHPPCLRDALWRWICRRGPHRWPLRNG